MATEQVTPKDILDDANKLYLVDRIGDMFNGYADINKSDRKAYIQGRLDERSKGNCSNKNLLDAINHLDALDSYHSYADEAGMEGHYHKQESNLIEKLKVSLNNLRKLI